MKVSPPALVLAALAALPAAHAAEVTPVGKVLQLLTEFQAKTVAAGEEAKKLYTEFSDWCEDRSTTLQNEIKTGKGEVETLKATIAEETATMSALSTKVEQLSASITEDGASLTAATEIRAKESKDFAAEEKELTEVIDTLERAIRILEKEMQSGGASMLQVKNAGSVAQALSVMVQASMLGTADAAKLTALVQSSQESEDAGGEMSLGAPSAAAYESHSSGIIDSLQDLMEKAESQLDKARAKETSALHNFELLKQSLEDEIKAAEKDMTAAKTSMAGSGEMKSVAEGDLQVTTKDLKEDTVALGDLHQTCMAKAEDFEAATKSREEELKALAKAKEVLSETTGGAVRVSYGLSQVSFLQTARRSRLSSRAELVNFGVVRLVRNLGRKQHSAALTQLASRMALALRSSSGSGQDPFAKVKGLIEGMIAKLLEDADAESTQKAHCDKELAESEAKQEEKTMEIGKMSTKIDQMTARSTKLREEVASLQKGLGELTASQAEMDKLRIKEHDEYVKDKADTEAGLEGVKLALKVLRDYYATGDKAHAVDEGGASGIIGLLEVVESDFAKSLSEMTAEEEGAAVEYKQGSEENEVEKATKQQDVKYKTKEAASLDKAVAEVTSDRSGVQSQLDAVEEYLATLKKACIAKPEAYGARKARREAEIAGLKEALQALEGEAALIQQGSRHKLRGQRRRVAAIAA